MILHIGLQQSMWRFCSSGDLCKKTIMPTVSNDSETIVLMRSLPFPSPWFGVASNQQECDLLVYVCNICVQQSAKEGRYNDRLIWYKCPHASMKIFVCIYADARTESRLMMVMMEVITQLGYQLAI